MDVLVGEGVMVGVGVTVGVGVRGGVGVTVGISVGIGVAVGIGGSGGVGVVALGEGVTPDTILTDLHNSFRIARSIDESNYGNQHTEYSGDGTYYLEDINYRAETSSPVSLGFFCHHLPPGIHLYGDDREGKGWRCFSAKSAAPL